MQWLWLDMSDCNAEYFGGILSPNNSAQFPMAVVWLRTADPVNEHKSDPRIANAPSVRQLSLMDIKSLVWAVGAFQNWLERSYRVHVKSRVCSTLYNLSNSDACLLLTSCLPQMLDVALDVPRAVSQNVLNRTAVRDMERGSAQTFQDCFV